MKTSLATKTHEWIEEICHRFSDASGWPLHYLRADASPEFKPQAARTDSPEHCWSTEIHDGEGRIGTLYTDLPPDTEDDRSFLTVCKLAELLADVMNRLAAADKSLASKTDQVSTLVDIGLSIPKEEDLLDAMNQLLRAAIGLTGFRSAAFFLLNPNTNELKLRVSQEVDLQQIPFITRDLSKNPPDLMALTRESVLLRRDPNSNESMWLPGDAAMALCVAVQSNAGPIGTLWTFDRRLRTPDEREAHILESIAAQIAVLLERVVLLRESATQQRIQRDLKVASECQCPELLGDTIDEFGFDTAAVCTSRYELGGDLCELIRLDSHRTVIAVGDASGDSVPAAMVMSAVRGALRTLSSFDPADVARTELVMHRINQTLHAITPPHQFMSLLYGVIDISDRSLTYTNAGHPTPIHVCDGKTTMLESHGMLLGVTEEATYERSVLQLSAGDTLVLFSDGISEAMNGRRRLFRSDGITGAIKDRCSGTAQEVLQTIWEDLEQHTAGTGDADDRTLLVIKIPQ